MVKIYIGNSLNISVVLYTFTELFRYINIDFEIIQNFEQADIVYDYNKQDENKIYITPNKLFWNNFKNQYSIPKSPLNIKGDITYIYENDIVASTFFMLSGYEEYLNPKRDQFNRFLYEYSFYKKDKIYHEPTVEKYRKKLVQELNGIGIRSEIKNIWQDKEFGLFLTHDVDGLYKYKNIFKSLVKIILKPSKFSIKEMFQSKQNTENDPYYAGFKYLINLSNKYNFKSTFFFITKVREQLEDFYNIDNATIMKTVKTIEKSGFEIGLHGSLQSYNNNVFLKEEKEYLKNCKGIRQHYLRYDIKITPKMHNNFFKYDSSLGFADMVGFRRGTCLPFKLYDLENEKILDIFEFPLIVMEHTLKNYMRLQPDQAYNAVINIIDMIKQNNGLFTFLWHPGNCSDEWDIWLKKVYEPIIEYLHKSNVISLIGEDIVKNIQK